MDTTLSDIYQQLKKTLKKYEPPFAAGMSCDARYELWSEFAMCDMGCAMWVS